MSDKNTTELLDMMFEILQRVIRMETRLAKLMLHEGVSPQKQK